MNVCKLNKNITKIIIVYTGFTLFFSCNVTKHLKDSEKLLVKNEISIEKKNDLKKIGGLNVYDINEVLKPEPNTKIGLRSYYLIDVNKREKFVKERNQRCNERKNSRINKISKKLKKTEKNKINADSPQLIQKYNKKISKLESKKSKKEEKECSKFDWLKNLGEEPVLYDTNDEYRNKRKLKILLKNYGYYHSNISVTNQFKKHNNKKVIVTYRIIPGIPHTINNVSYIIEDSTLKSIIEGDSVNSELKTGLLFNIKYLEDERKRISDLLKNRGYFKFSQDFIYFTIDTIAKNYKTDITINITNPKNEKNEILKHKIYKINQVYIYPDFKPTIALKERENYFLRNDTIIFYSKTNQKFNFIYNDIPRINPQAITRGLYIEPGKLFRLNDIQATYRYLASLQIITITNIQLNEKTFDINKNDSTDALIDCEIRLTQDSIQGYEIAAEITNTAGNIGIQSNIGYKHNNLFRNTEVFDLKINFALKRITQNKAYDIVDTLGFFNSIEYGFDLNLNFPRLMAPVPLKKFIKRSNPKTTFNIKYNKLKEPGYSTSLAGISFGYFWYSTNTIFHDFRPVTGDFVKLIEPSVSFLDWIDENNLEENYENHFIFGSSYRFSFNNQLYTEKNNFFNLTVSTKLTGNTLSLYKKWTDAEKINGSYEVAGNTFAQFIKTDFDIRYYRKLKRKNDKLVFRLFAGTAYPFGNLNVIPFSEQYFSGGANGIRAWQERSLGPGSFSDTLQDYPTQRADIKLEGNFEYRMKLFGQFEGAFFLDAGNIWAVNKEDQRQGALFKTDSFFKEIALGSGLGIRYDLTIIVIRFDFGIKIFDPALPENKRFIPIYDQYDNEDWMFNFGIGYPF